MDFASLEVKKIIENFGLVLLFRSGFAFEMAQSAQLFTNLNASLGPDNTFFMCE